MTGEATMQGKVDLWGGGAMPPLSTHFSLEEFTRSDTATRLGIAYQIHPTRGNTQVLKLAVCSLPSNASRLTYTSRQISSCTSGEPTGSVCRS